MSDQGAHLHPEVREIYLRLYKTYLLEAHHSIWTEILAHMLWMRDNQHPAFTDETAALLADTLKELPERR